MRATIFSVLLVAGCLDTGGFESEPAANHWDLNVHITSPTTFDQLDVALPDANNQTLESRPVPASTEYAYFLDAQTEPTALAFSARLDGVLVAKGTLPDIHYVGDGVGDFTAELAITLTAVGE